MRYLPHTDQEIQEMLQVVGANNLDDLFKSIPAACRMQGDLQLPPAQTEWELGDGMGAMAASNASRPSAKVYLGAGCYDHFVPSHIGYLTQRSEFITAYTPYQPELSQGTLQAIYEYQTLMTRLTGMEVVNASVYDGAMALAESLLMAMRVQRKNKVAVSSAIHPLYRQVVNTYLNPGGFEVVEVGFGADGRTDLASVPDDVACLAVQSPNFFGCVEDLAGMRAVCDQKKILMVTGFCEAISLGLLKSHGSQGTDILFGEGQSLGLGQNFGGPYLGVMGCTTKLMRQMPGRLAGKTVDTLGRQGFVITLSTREQHIRREKATSNICSNQNLCALTAGIFLASLGKGGIRALARQNYDKAEYLKGLLTKVGFQAKFASPTFNEFVVQAPQGFEKTYARLQDEGHTVAGLPLECYYPALAGCYLLCVTETKTKADLDALAEGMKS